MTEIEEKRFGPTSGVVTGWIGIAGCAAVVVLLPFASNDRTAFRFVVGAALAAVFIWAFVARPRIILSPSRLRLRNALSTWEIPTALVDGITIGVVTRVEVAGRPYDGAAVGRPVRLFKRAGESRWSSPDLVPDLLIEEVELAAAAARAAGHAGGDVKRVWAVPELTAIGVLSLALLILFV